MWQSEGGTIEMELVKVNGIGKVYRKKTVLHDVNFTIEQGEIYGLVGNNGAGKTTLLRIIGNMLRPTSGEIVFNKEQFKSKVRIGVLIERPAYYFDMSAYENIKAKALALGVRYAPQDINDLLELVGLHDVGKKNAAAFSTGMKQRLGIALAMVGEPDLLLFDEPINGLDPQGILEIRNVLLKIHAERDVTMIISSHILDELAKTATRFLVLNNGSIIKDCTKEQFVSECGDKAIDEYYLQLVSGN